MHQEAAGRLFRVIVSATDPNQPVALQPRIALNMDINIRVLLIAMAMFYVVGMAIFLLWKLFEPRRDDQSRSLIDVVVKPSLVMAVGIVFIGICMIYPQFLLWTFGAGAVFGVISYFRMPAKEKQAMANAIDQPEPQSKWSIARLLLAVIIVFVALVSFLEYYVPH